MARVLISGASGLIGSALAAKLSSEGHEILRLVRRPARAAGEVEFSPEAVNFLPKFACDAVVHLAGESVMGLWTAAKKRRIADSRIVGTRVLAEALARLATKPAVMVSASAVGYYGERGNEVLTEASGPGEGFLPETCVKWEAATAAARAAGIRVVNPRIGLVLARRGGMLKTLLPIFRLGLGSRLGDGQHWMTWIALEDLVALITFALNTPSLAGPVNATAPNPVTNTEFTKTLAKVLRRPTFLPVPTFALNLAPGNMAREALLASERVIPTKALEAGFRFQFETLEEALTAALAAGSR